MRAHRPFSLSAILSLALLAAPAFAQVALTPAPPAFQSSAADPDGTLVEELVVTARDKGPAWWTVADADTTVYVLGSPSLAPERMQWDRSVFERRLTGANAVILPFQDVRVKTKGVFGAAIAMLRLRAGPFEENVPEPLKSRFIAARTNVAQGPRRYGTHNPLAAALLMTADYREASHLTTSDPTKLIKYLAQQAKVPVSQRSYDLAPLMGAIIKTPSDAGYACLYEVLAQVEAGPEVTRAAARAWNEGDVRGALHNERTYERCVASVPGAQSFDARTKADQVAAIEAALKVPGHAIAVVQLRPLLAQGGVLDQLRAKGFAVKTPGE